MDKKQKLASPAIPNEVGRRDPEGGSGAGTMSMSSGRPASEGQVICWLASSMPLEKKIEAAVAAMPRVSKGPHAVSAVSPRLACAVLQFAANALLRSLPSAASSQGRAGVPKKDDRERGFMRESLWSLVLGCLHAAPDQVAATVSGVGGHLIRPIHAAMLAVVKSCRTTVSGDKEDGSGDDGLDYAALANAVGAVLMLLRGPHAASFQPQMPTLCSMLASLSAELTALLDGVAMQLSPAQIESKSDDTTERAGAAVAAVHRAAHMVVETICTVALAVGRAPNQRKVFAMAVEDLIAPAALHFRACTNLQQRVRALQSDQGCAPKLAETAASDGWRVYRKMQAIIGESLFSQEHLADFALAYSFRNAAAVSANAADNNAVEPEADSGGGEDTALQGRSKKLKGGAGSGYRGDKLKSYQASLFAKLLSLARCPGSAHSVAVVDGKGRGKGGGGKVGKAGKGRASDVGEGAEKSEQQTAGRPEDDGRETTREAALMWLPELLRLFVLCGRRCADPSVEVEGLELAFGEQSAGSLLGGSNAGGGGGRGGQSEVVGKVKKRKKESENAVGAIAEMDFCRELLHLCDTATGGYLRVHGAPSTVSDAVDAQVVLLVRTYSNILEAVVQLDVYRAHVFSEAGEVKPYLRHVVDVLVAVGIGHHEGGEGGERKSGVARPLMQALSQMLQIDHAAVEPHAQRLCTLALSAIRAAAPSASSAPYSVPAYFCNRPSPASAAEMFLSELSRTMNRLQQGERFIEWLLAAARLHPVPPVDARRDPTLITLSASLHDAKWGQLPALCERALQELAAHHMPCALRLRKLDFMAEKGGSGPRGEALVTLEALVHVCEVMETILRCACGKAGGPDSSALQQLCVRASSQVLRPLLTSCVKSLRDAAPTSVLLPSCCALKRVPANLLEK